MNSSASPFKFDVSASIATARRKLNNNVEGVTITVPFGSFRVSPDDLEQKIAAEIVERMADKRVLSGSECCDNCIDYSISSILDIRSLIVDKKVILFKAKDGSLYMILDWMQETIKQFLTYQENLEKSSQNKIFVSAISDFKRPQENREKYFAALEMLRNHLCCCLIEISRIAKVAPPYSVKDGKGERAWRLENYKELPSFND